MAAINRLDNTASIIFDGDTINSNTTETLLLIAPTITKTVSSPTASIGDILTYTVTLTSLSLLTISNLVFTDIIPAGASYVANSFTVNAVTATPVVTGNTLTYTIPTILGLAIAVISFNVEVIGGDI